MKNSKVEISIRISDDGSHTVYNPDLKAHYHSVHGAIQESEHVFIKNALRRQSKKSLSVLEFGFGTGLNALLTYREALEQELRITYSALELHPLSLNTVRRLNYPEILGVDQFHQVFIQMHDCPWEMRTSIRPNFHLQKSKVDFHEAILSTGVDVVYFDAFGPGTQPELWSESMFERIHDCMNPGGVLSTYSAKGDVRRAMLSVGFKVEKVPGPTGKREMLVAIK